MRDERSLQDGRKCVETEICGMSPGRSPKPEYVDKDLYCYTGQNR